MIYDYSNSLYSMKKDGISRIVILINQNQKEADIKKQSVHNNSISYSEFSNPFYIYSKASEAEFNDFRKKLKEVLLLNEVVVLSQSFFSDSKYYLFDRIKELFNVYDEDEESQISVDSLKSMLTFLFLINRFVKPKLTLNESGTFQLSWKKDNFNLVTLRFKEEESLDYVIFRTSKHVKKPIILNGNMNIFDFKDYLIDIGLYIEISER